MRDAYVYGNTSPVKFELCSDCQSTRGNMYEMLESLIQSKLGMYCLTTIDCRHKQRLQTQDAKPAIIKRLHAYVRPDAAWFECMLSLAVTLCHGNV